MITKIVATVAVAVLASACVSTATVQATFDPKAAAYIHQQGSGRIEGQAFLRQQGGGVVKAAGEDVYLIPATAYARERFAAIYGGNKSTFFGKKIENTPPEYEQYTRKTKADAEGRFVFENVAPGSYLVQTQVFWSVPGSYVPSGANFYETVEVSSKATSNVILAGR
jgi:hypothetical protein